MNRRQFIQQSALVSLGVSGASVCSANNSLILPNEAARSLTLRNYHTGEKFSATYWEKGDYLIDALADIYVLMRDHRADQVAAMDVTLLDELHRIQQNLNTQKEIYLFSGYRSPKTNEMLRRTHRGVAKRSLHMQGRALDFRIAGVSNHHVHKATRAISEGGVGYYQNSGFIHLDTGRQRSWLG